MRHALPLNQCQDFAVMASSLHGGGTTRGRKPAPCDRDVEVYKALRAHELMLNQAASAFEHAVTTRLVTLNGGAAAAFLNLTGSTFEKRRPRP